MKESMSRHFKERFAGEVDDFSIEPKLPSSLNIELNSSCNQRCFFCPYHGKYAKHRVHSSVMSKDFAISILEQAAKLGIGYKELGLYLAGEALMYDGLADVISYAHNLGFPYIFLTSNGMLANRQKMSELISAGLNSIRFSINAADPERYLEYHGVDGFSTVTDNIKDLHDYIIVNGIEFSVSISCVVTAETNGMQEEFRDIFERYVDEIIFMPVDLSRSTMSEDQKKRYSLSYGKQMKIDSSFICPMLFNTMYINALGEVVPCCYAYDQNVCFGKLEDGFDLGEIWRNDNYKKYRRVFLENGNDIDTLCRSCSLRSGGIDTQLMD